MSATRQSGLVVLLGAVTALGSLAIHLFVPAMPQAAVALAVSPAAMQLAVTTYLAGIAVGQLVSGPVSDRAGQRPVMIVGMAVFIAGSALCWAAPSIAWLLAGRFIQALGGSAGLVVSRSIAGDAGERGSRDIALLTAIVLLAPMLSPVVGSMLAEFAGWRSVFAALTVAGAVSLPLIIWRVPKREVGPGGTVISGFHRVLTSGLFLRNLLLGATVSCGLYTFLTASPFLLVGYYGAAPAHLGTLYGLVAFGAVLGALTSSRISAGLGAAATIRLGAVVTAIGGLAMLMGAIAQWHHVAGLIAPMAIFAFGGGLVTPSAMVAALSAIPGRVGTTVSAYGSLQMACNALASSAIAALSPRDPLILGVAIAGLATLALALGARGGATSFRKSD